MTIYRTQKKANYVMLDKGFLNDRRLSWKAKGLLAYMLSLPDDWSFCLADLATRSKCGRDATANIVKELTNAGYIHKEQVRAKGGKFSKMEFVVFETTRLAKKSLTDNSLTEEPQTENASLLMIKSLKNDLLIKNKDDRNLSSACQFYELNGFGSLMAHVSNKIGHWIDDLSEELVIYAMKLAVENNVLRWNYVEKILLDWRNKKLKCIAEIEADRLRFQAQKQQTIRFQPQGRQEIIPDWFQRRHEDNHQPQAEQAIDFEAERQKILATLREVTGRAR